MKTHKSALYMAILAATVPTELGFASLSLQQSEGGWCQLLPAGHFKAVDGRPFDVEGGQWFIDEVTATELIAELKSRNTRAVIDYEHQTLTSKENGQPAPASGWIEDAQWRGEQGLWIKPKWTKPAEGFIDNEEYCYLSAVFPYDKKTGRPLRLHSAALTNTPGLDGLNKVALSQRYFSSTESENTPTTPEDTTMDLKTLIMLLGLADTATEADVKAAIEKLQKDGKTSATEVATLTAALNDSQTAAVDPAKYVPIEAAAEMQTQIATLTAQLQTGGLDAVIEEAKKDGRLLPAMESWARDLGKKDLAALTAYLDNAAPIAALTTQQAGQETPPRETDAHGLTEEELEAAALTGKSPEEYAALKAT